MAMFLGNGGKQHKRTRHVKLHKRATECHNYKQISAIDPRNDLLLDSDDEFFYDNDYEPEETMGSEEFEFFDPIDNNDSIDDDDEDDDSLSIELEQYDEEDDVFEEDVSESESTDYSSENEDEGVYTISEDYSKYRMLNTPPIKGNTDYNWPWL